jgi:hypothetical protein
MLPHRIKLRVLKLDPRLVKSKTLATPHKSADALTEQLLPIRANDRRDKHDPNAEAFNMDNLLPILPNDLVDMLLPR